ncbi:hypothetical protein BDZ97DRAFT_1698280, partial [Flammula alnicola]
MNLLTMVDPGKRSKNRMMKRKATAKTIISRMPWRSLPSPMKPPRLLSSRLKLVALREDQITRLKAIFYTTFVFCIYHSFSLVYLKHNIDLSSIKIFTGNACGHITSVLEDLFVENAVFGTA